MDELYARIMQKRNMNKGKEIMKDLLPNGAIVEGTADQINAVRKMFGFSPLYKEDGIHYLSSTHGVVSIQDMNTEHIKNAVRKRLVSNSTNLNTKTTLAEFLTQVTVTVADVTLLGLLQELQRRQALGEK